MVKKTAHNPTKQQQAKAELRRNQMLELYVAGNNERAIAGELGVSQPLVNKEIKRALEEHGKAGSEVADHVRRLQMSRYTTLINKWWDGATSGDQGAANLVLKACYQIDKINGIIPDKPLIDMRSINVIDQGAELMRTLKEMASRERKEEEAKEQQPRDEREEQESAEPGQAPDQWNGNKKIIELQLLNKTRGK